MTGAGYDLELYSWTRIRHTKQDPPCITITAPAIASDVNDLVCTVDFSQLSSISNQKFSLHSQLSLKSATGETTQPTLITRY